MTRLHMTVCCLLTAHVEACVNFCCEPVTKLAKQIAIFKLHLELDMTCSAVLQCLWPWIPRGEYYEVLVWMYRVLHVPCHSASSTEV